MCPHPRIAIKSDRAQREENCIFGKWLRSARCVTSLYFCNRKPSIVCLKCKSKHPRIKKGDYFGVITRHIHLGLAYSPEKCDLCHVPVVAHRHFLDCDRCPHKLEEFIAYLIRESNKPWNDSDATVLALSRLIF